MDSGKESAGGMGDMNTGDDRGVGVSEGNHSITAVRSVLQSEDTTALRWSCDVIV